MSTSQSNTSGPISEKLPNCRIFLGNLASEKTSKAELRQIFSRYGKIIEEPVLRRSFGFIQYDNPSSAQRAIEGEQHRIIGGMRLGLSRSLQEDS
jgi:RNA recognition motif-containing protein